MIIQLEKLMSFRNCGGKLFHIIHTPSLENGKLSSQNSATVKLRHRLGNPQQAGVAHFENVTNAHHEVSQLR